MANLDFIAAFRKKAEKLDNVNLDFSPPAHWYSTGNLALNKIMSGSFRRGIPQGRVTVMAGPSGSGKSFLTGNIIKNAQKDGAFIICLDSENALDPGFLTKIGVDCSADRLLYLGVVTVQDVTTLLSDFIAGYEGEHGRNNPNAPKVVIVLDSLDMLLTESENANFDKGVQKGDQGQRSKQMKHLLRTLVNRIARLNIAFIATHQVYANQDLLNGEGLWIVNNSVKYSASQIALITKLKLKDGTEVTGVRMRVETYKSRFAKLGSKIELEVPYAKGMNPFSGFLEMMVNLGVVVQGGAWYSFTGADGVLVKFQRKQLDQPLVDKILMHPIILEQERMAESLMSGELSIPDEAEIAELEDEVEIIEEE